jgi:thiol-disulfide isomerase/thioredoxin
MTGRLLAGLVVGLLVFSGCGATVPGPGAPAIEVDTPQLRQLKAAAGIEDCAPGTATDGGLPHLTLPCLGGGPDVDLATLQGPAIVNLWASNCAPCRQEMPALEEFHQQYGDQVPVIGVDYQDQQPAAALELARRTGATYPLLADPGGDLNANDPVPVIPGIPFFLLLGADGQVQVVPGGVTSSAELADLVHTHLGVDL